MFTRSLRTIALILLILTAVQGAYADAGRGSVVTLRLWGGVFGIPSKDKTDPWSRAQRAVFERFQELHPNYRVSTVSGMQITGPAAQSGFAMAMASGTGPDVFYVNLRQLNTYINQSFLSPLNEYIARDPGVMKHVQPVIRDVITVDGKVYCVPWFQTVQALYYRKDLYREAGLNPNKPPKNWDEFYEYAKKLTIPEKGQYGFIWDSAPQGTSYHWINFLWGAGGDVVAQDKSGQWRAVFNSPAGVEALKFYKKLSTDVWVRPSDGKRIAGVSLRATDFPTDVAQGRAAQWFGSTTDIANQSELNPSLIGIAPIPAGPAGYANEINAGMWGMSSQITDQRVRDAAWEFIKFMSGDEADRVRTRAYVEAGLGKLVNPDKLQKYGYTEYLQDIPKDWITANKESFKHGHPEPHGKNCEMIYTELDYPLVDITLHPDKDPKALLDTCAERINTKMLGYTPPKVMAKKRHVAFGIFLFILTMIGVLAGSHIKKLAASHPDEEHQGSRPVRGRSVHLIAWLFMLPAVLSVLTWNYYPLVRGMIMAFQDYHILGASRFIGLDNFIEAVGQDTFWLGILNSILYACLNLGLGFMLPVFLALMLNEVPRAKMFFRTVYYLPAVTSGLVIVFLWKWFYDPTPRGLFNTIIQYYNEMAVSLASHLAPIFGHLQISTGTWLQDPKMAMLCVVLPGIWAGAGPGSIIYLAAMKGIPEEMYEAADLDGASVWTKIWRITLPSLAPLLIINFVGALIGSFKAMENIFVLTGGGPLNHTHTIGLEIWYNAFMYLKFGYATAAAWMMGSLLIGFTVYQLRILRNVKFSATGQED